MTPWPTSAHSLWLAVCALAALALGAWPVRAHAAGKFRAGQILIVGNTETPSYLVELLLPFGVGDTVSGEQIRLAQSRLRRASLWIDPTVHALDDPVEVRECKDVLIQFQERRWNWLLFAGYEFALGRFTGDLGRMNAAALRVRDKLVGE